jgi:hypothetical protein
MVGADTMSALQQYEKVFVTKLDEMGEDGPSSKGMFRALRHGGLTPPDRLRRLFLRLLDPVPSKRPTAQEAVEELREIQNECVSPAILNDMH